MRLAAPSVLVQAFNGPSAASASATAPPVVLHAPPRNASAHAAAAKTAIGTALGTALTCRPEGLVVLVLARHLLWRHPAVHPPWQLPKAVQVVVHEVHDSQGGHASQQVQGGGASEGIVGGQKPAVEGTGLMSQASNQQLLT